MVKIVMMNVDLGTWANVATALFTLAAAVAAWLAASVAKSAADESSRVAKEQTDALMTAAKANALASRIAFYERQIAPLRETIQNGNINADVVVNLQDKKKELESQQKHLVYWLDRQTDALGVGLRFECPGSELNSEVARWRRAQPTPGRR